MKMHLMFFILKSVPIFDVIVLSQETDNGRFMASM